MSFGFGSTPAKTPTFSFGATATPPPASSTNPFGGFGAQPAQPIPTASASTGLFDSQPTAQPAATSTTPGKFTFGNNSATNAQAGPSTSIFGNASTNTTSNVFGATPSSTFSFGNPNQAAAPSPFGQSQQQQQAQQPQSNIFQSQNQNQNTFGQSHAPSFLGRSQQPQQQQQQQQQQQPSKPLHPWLQSLPNLPGTMMFDELTSRAEKGQEVGMKAGQAGAEFAGNLKKLETIFHDHYQKSFDIQAGNLADELAEDRRRLIRLEGNTTIYFQSLVALTKRVHTLVRQSEETVAEYSRVHGVLVAANQSGGKGVAGEAPRRVYIEFFTKLAIDMDEKMKLFQKTLDQIERQLVSLQKDQHLPTAQAIAQAVANNQRSVMSLAAEVAELEGRLKGLVVHYRREFRRKNNTALDPVEAYRSQQGVPRLSVKSSQAGAFYDEMDDLVVL